MEEKKKRIKTQVLLTPFTRLTQNIKYKAVNSTEENIGETLGDLALDNYFSDTTPESQSLKHSISWTSAKRKISNPQKTPSRE